MKKFISILSIAFLLSCSSDESSETQQQPTPTPTPQEIRLVKVVETRYSDNTTNTIDFVYSGNTLSYLEETRSNGNVYRTKYIYENEKLVKLNHFVNGSISSPSLFYYIGNLITNYNIYEDGINVGHSYEYNTSGYLIKDTHFEDGVIQSVSNFTLDNNGNVLTATNSSFSSQNHYQYDNKKNPYARAYPEAFLKSLGTYYSANNVTSESINNDPAFIVYEFSYNSDGYPTERIEKMNGVPYEKTVYTYN